MKKLTLLLSMIITVVGIKKKTSELEAVNLENSPKNIFLIVFGNK